MDITPGEKAVLRQIGALYATEKRRDHQLKALVMQWPPTHRESYNLAYHGLHAKHLIEAVGAQYFRITEAGLKALGVAPPKAQPQAQVPRPPEKKPARPHMPVRAAPKPPAGLLSGLARFLGRSS